MDEREEYRGHYIRMEQDEDAYNPRGWDHLGQMVFFHRRYRLGDQHGMTPDELKAKLKHVKVQLPVYMYEHSGIGLSTDNSQYPYNCPWDAGLLGYIYATQDDIRKWFGVKVVDEEVTRRAYDVLQAEVEEYSAYVSGDVWGWIAEEEDGEHIDSCWGYFDGYKSKDGMMSEAKAAIDYHIEHEIVDLKLAV